MDVKTKVAIIAGQLVVGGAEKQLYLWLANMDRSRFELVVLTLHPGYGDYWEEPIHELGIPLISIPRDMHPLFRLRLIIKTLKAFNPSLIHGWHLFASPYAGMAAKVLGAKSLGGLRDSIVVFKKSRRESLLSLLFTDAIVANSASAVHDLARRYKWKAEKIFSVQNAINGITGTSSTVKENLRKQIQVPEEKIILGSISRLDPKKRFDLLFECMVLLKAETENFHLLLIGDGPEKKHLQELASKFEISEFITFTGEIPDARELLSLMDIFCFTSCDEGLANVVMEAAFAGVPVVAWKFPFNTELLEDKRMALLIDPLDVVEMTKAIRKLMISKDLRERLGRAAEEHIKKDFSLERYIQSMTDVYESLLLTDSSRDA